MLGRPQCGLLAAALGVTSLAWVGASPASAAILPALGVGDIRLMEPFGGAPDVTAAVPVVLDRPADASVTFTWTIRAGTAGSADLVLGSGSGSIAAGQQATSVAVVVHGDSVTETLAESATVEVGGVVGAGVERGLGQVVIRDASFDGVPVGFVIGDVTVPEPETGSVRVAVPVTLPAPVKKSTSLSWELRSQYTAVVGEDAPAASGTLSLPRNTTSGSIPVTINGDLTPEPLETLLVKPLSATNTQIGDPWGQVRILRDDADGVALPWTAPASVVDGPGTTGYFESSLGDWVGGGNLTYDTLASGGIKVSEADGQLRVDIDADRDTHIRLTTSGDGTSPIVAGAWTVHGYQYGGPGFDASQGATSCSSPDATTTFVVEDVARATDGTLDRFVLRFEQFCPGSLDPMRGFVRYVRGDTTTPPPPKDPSTYPWQPPAGAVPATGSWLYFESAPGEWVGQGQTRLLSVDGASRTNWSPAGVQLSFGDAYSETWNFLAAMPEWVPSWRTGWFPAAYGAASNPVKAPLNVDGEGRGCNKVTGDVVVDTADHDADGALTALTLRFTQLCDDDPDPLRGVLRWTLA